MYKADFVVITEEDQLIDINTNFIRNAILITNPTSTGVKEFKLFCYTLTNLTTNTYKWEETRSLTSEESQRVIDKAVADILDLKAKKWDIQTTVGIGNIMKEGAHGLGGAAKDLGANSEGIFKVGPISGFYRDKNNTTIVDKYPIETYLNIFYIGTTTDRMSGFAFNALNNDVWVINSNTKKFVKMISQDSLSSSVRREWKVATTGLNALLNTNLRNESKHEKKVRVSIKPIDETKPVTVTVSVNAVEIYKNVFPPSAVSSIYSLDVDVPSNQSFRVFVTNSSLYKWAELANKE